MCFKDKAMKAVIPLKIYVHSHFIQHQKEPTMPSENATFQFSTIKIKTLAQRHCLNELSYRKEPRSVIGFLFKGSHQRGT